jgi:hypothetical protein
VKKAWEWLKQEEYDPQSIQDDDEVRRLYLECWLGERDYDVYQIISDYQLCAQIRFARMVA